MFEKLVDFIAKKPSEVEKFDEAMKELEELKKENAELKLERDETHHCSGFCSVCKHGIAVESFCYGMGKFTNYICEFNCNCSDFERVK